MNVQFSKPLGEGRKIEIGEASWRLNQDAVDLAGGARSVRAYYRNARGRFRSTSPQVSLRDLVLMIEFAADKDEFSPDQCTAMDESLSNSVKRQS
jgi:hypothetical protein